MLRLNKPPADEIVSLKNDSVHISYLDPFNDRELVLALAAQGVQAISMEMIPRTTLAQKMDALSSQASLAGYVAVTVAAARLETIFPMMMTPAGTLSPARVFVIGAGVAGLQAIATARRLGARVEAYDTRPAVAEQVQSLGARFVQIDIGDTGETRDGYAKALTEQQLETQRAEMARRCTQADVVITTAQVFGRRAPRIITKEMIEGMRPGSIIVDMAVESGGNVEGSEKGKEVDVHGVRIIGFTNLAGRVPKHASQMYSTNLGNLVEELWDKEEKTLRIDPENEILRGCLITRGGEICNERIKEAYGL
jgi:NAD(P) transhydrogenase subunit alpha